jgi:23S rRNA (guanosine2251-2'-O)-methyltransferase
MNIICGINPVLEALSSGTRHFDRLLVAKGLRNRRVSEAMRLASQRGVPLRFETRETLDRMAGEVPHQGLVGVVSAKPVMTLEALLEQARPPELVVVLDGVEDPRNLGAILRTAEAAGADGVLLPERHTAGLSETVARASAGGLEHVRVARIGNVVQALEELKQRGFWVVGFDAAGSERWDAVDYKGKVAMVFGGEGRGIRRLVREKCDHVASLPLFGHVGSLNVSVVAGIALYEAVRQRGAVPSQLRPIPVSTVRPGADGPAFEPEEPPEEPEERLALVHVEEHDATAWSHPVVLNNVGPRSRRHPRHEDRRLHARGKRRGGAEGPARTEPRSGPAPATGTGPGEPTGPAAGDRPRQGKRRRRRNRGHEKGHGPAPGHPRQGGPPSQDAGQGTLGSEPPAGAGGPQPGGEGAPGGPRKGRRHRRRKRRPPAPSGG